MLKKEKPGVKMITPDYQSMNSKPAFLCASASTTMDDHVPKQGPEIIFLQGDKK